MGETRRDVSRTPIGSLTTLDQHLYNRDAAENAGVCHMKEDDVLGCSKCGASVYKEHIDQGLARYEGKDLLCPHCVVEFEQSPDSGGGAFAPIEFDDVEDSSESAVDMSESQVQTLSSSMLGETGAWDESRFQRAVFLLRTALFDDRNQD